MKHSVNAKKAHSDLQQALDRMLKVLKNLNDSLHVVGLKGFPVSGVYNVTHLHRVCHYALYLHASICSQTTSTLQIP